MFQHVTRMARATVLTALVAGALALVALGMVPEAQAAARQSFFSLHCDANHAADVALSLQFQNALHVYTNWCTSGSQAKGYWYFPVATDGALLNTTVTISVRNTLTNAHKQCTATQAEDLQCTFPATSTTTFATGAVFEMSVAP